MVAASSVVFAADDRVRPVETTIAHKLLVIERGVRDIPVDTTELLRAVIDDATNAAVRTHRHPRTRDEALAVLEAMQLALVRYNFLQPPQEKDWPNTMGIALQPLKLSADELKIIMLFPDNAKRKEHFDQEQPFYYVDCDMGSQIFMAVGERLGWDIRLVELPQHNFVRWHLSNKIEVNWDWTHGRSVEDDDYASKYEDVRLRQLYLRSFDRDKAEAYFVGLVASEAKRPADAERLFLDAIAALPHHPLTLNNFAWLYATTPEFEDKSDVAVAYALGAWSMRPTHGNFADTVACALAMNGKKALAEKIEEFAIEHPNNAAQRQGFQKNLARISAGEPCK